MALSRRELLIAGGITAAGSVLAPSAVRAQPPKRGGTLNLRLWDPPHFDLHAAGGLSYKLHIPMTFTHSRLVRHKTGPSVVPGTFQFEPDLAESWTQANETTYVFKLRRGVRWHNKPPANGREFVADDVVYTINRFLTTKGHAKIQRCLAKQQFYVTTNSGVYVCVWEGALQNYGPNIGFDYGGRLMATWLNR